MKEITINYESFIELLKNEERLETLENNGVNNWDFYGCQCDMTGDKECIFCTDDVERFLKENGKTNDYKN